MIAVSRSLLLLLTLLLAFVLSACTPKQKLLDIPEAENLLFSSDGRLFVSGTGIYEVIRDGERWQALSLYGERCGFAGIAQRDDWLYSVCTDGPLWAPKGWLLGARLQAGVTPVFQKLARLDGVALANGIAFDREGRFYVADSNYFGAGKVRRYQLSADAVPTLSAPVTVLAAGHGVSHPNGIRFVDDRLWLTDGGQVKRFTLQADGSFSAASVHHSSSTILDDLLPVCDGAIVADYLGGKVFYVDKDGRKRYESKPLSFPGASSVQIGRGPLFANNQLLITEKGILLETGSRIGDALVTVSVDFDLQQAARDCPAH